jgi:hypothetical protein
MTALVLENLKLIILFLFVGSIIGLSRFGGKSGSDRGAVRGTRSSTKPRKPLVARVRHSTATAAARSVRHKFPVARRRSPRLSFL